MARGPDLSGRRRLPCSCPDSRRWPADTPRNEEARLPDAWTPCPESDAAQAAQTREAILDPLVHVMARGGADLSMPAVAQEAGVSLRTVYRYFPSKRDLFAALNVHLDARIGYSLVPFPTDLDDFIVR